MRFSSLLLVSFSLLALTGCGDDDGRSCEPGATMTCTTGACSGTQTCLPDGTFGACECDGADTGPGDAGGADAAEDSAMAEDTSTAEDTSAPEDTSTPEDTLGPDTAPPPSCAETGESVSYSIRVVGVPEARAGRVAEGFNLDGVISSTANPTGCRKLDYTSPEGVEGVDNALIDLAAVLESSLGMPLTFDAALPITMDNVDSFVDDDCVSIAIADSAPIIGAIVDGHLSVGPVRRVDLAAAGISVTIRDVQVEADITATAVSNGVLGGVMTVAELAEAAAPLTMFDAATIAIILGGQADMNTPMCDEISGAVLFDTP